MGYGIFRASKLKTMGNLRGSLAHARREQDTPNADPKRIRDNILLTNTPTVQSVMDKYEELKPKKIRADQVRAIEVLITASPEAMEQMSKEQQIEYLKKGLEFSNTEFGGEKNLLHAEIHLDETTAHLTAFYIPLVTRKNARSGKVNTGLNAKVLLGNKQDYSDRQTRFYEQVSKDYGLERGEIGSKATHTRVSDWYRALNAEAFGPVIPDVISSLEKNAVGSFFVEVDQPKKNALGLLTQTEKVMKTVKLTEPKVNISAVRAVLSPFEKSKSRLKRQQEMEMRKRAKREIEQEKAAMLEKIKELNEEARSLKGEAEYELDLSIWRASEFSRELALEMGVFSFEELNVGGSAALTLNEVEEAVKSKVVDLVKLEERHQVLEGFKKEVDQEVAKWRIGDKRVFADFNKYKEYFSRLISEAKSSEKEIDGLKSELKDVKESKSYFERVVNRISSVLGSFLGSDLEESVRKLVDIAKKFNDPDFIKRRYDEFCTEMVERDIDKIIDGFNAAANNANSWYERKRNYDLAYDKYKRIFNYFGGLSSEDDMVVAHRNACEAMERDKHLANTNTNTQRRVVYGNRMR